MGKKCLESELAAVLIAVCKICNKKVRRNNERIYATPRTVARMCGYYTKHDHSLPNGNKAKRLLHELTRQGKIQCLGKVKLHSAERWYGGATSLSDAFMTIQIKDDEESVPN